MDTLLVHSDMVENLDLLISLTEKKAELLKQYKTSLLEELSDIIVDNTINDRIQWFFVYDKQGKQLKFGTEDDVMKFLEKPIFKDLKIFFRPTKN